jgi:hypothetical protein
MPKCPYCQNEMKNGYVEGGGANTLKWVDANIKRSLLSILLKKDCIILGESSPSYSFVESYYCEVCKKIIIDVN